MAQVPITGLPAGGPVDGTELIPAVQAGATVSLLSAQLVGPAGPTGPAGPPGPTGPTGATGATGPPFATLTRIINTTPNTLNNSDVLVVLDSSGGAIQVILPDATTYPARPLTVGMLASTFAANCQIAAQAGQKVAGATFLNLVGRTAAAILYPLPATAEWILL